MPNYLHFETISPNNQFSINCPVFNSEVKVRGCVTLRNKVYMGERIETRRGCQACISSGKCPVAEMVRRISFGRVDATDHCASDTPKVGRIPADILERIAPVVVQEQQLLAFGVTSAERELLDGSRARIDAQIASAPRSKTEGKVRQSAQEPRKTNVLKVVSKPDQPAQPAFNHAAASGDLAAALNAA